MSCPSCAMLIESDLDDAGINARVSYAKETLNLSDKKDLIEAKKIIQKNGYVLEN